jgi:hypothetical protein
MRIAVTRRARVGTLAFVATAALVPPLAVIAVGGGSAEDPVLLLVTTVAGLAVGLVGAVPWLIVLESVYRRRPDAGSTLLPVLTGIFGGALAASALIWAANRLAHDIVWP